MLSLSQERRRNTDTGSPIYGPFTNLNANELFIRKGQLTLIAAGSGVGKSAIILSWVQRGNGAGLTNRVMYISSDTDGNTMQKRSVAIATGWETSYVDQLVRGGMQDQVDSISDSATAHIAFVTDSSPDQQDIKDQVLAYLTVHGVYPEVIIMDNLKNLWSETDDDFKGLEESCVFLHELARDTGAAVIALHHVVGAYADGDKAIPKSGLLGKIDKTPEVIFTLYRLDNMLYVCPVKNRNGRADPTAKWALPIHADLARMQYEG